jgi:hypothetical protein
MILSYRKRVRRLRMNLKLLLILTLFTISGLTGLFIGKGQIKKENIEFKEKVAEFHDKTDPINIRTISSVAKPEAVVPVNEIKKVTKENTGYLKSYLEDSDNKELYNKTLRIFSKSENKENIALWVTLGTSFTNDKGYTTLYKNSLNKLNENPDQALQDINSQIKELGEKDDFLRGMLNNLVHNLEVEDEKKIGFFGVELRRSIKLDKEGGLKEGSTSLINSMILLKQYVSNSQQVKSYLEESLNQNKFPKEREALRLRFLEYFPDLKNEI